MSRTFFDPSRFAALAERLEAEGLAAAADFVELTPDRLSGAELRLWFIDQFEPGTAVYTIAAGLRLRGLLDLEALRRAVVTVAEQHESLRCRFPTVSGVPSAVVDPVCRTELTVETLAGDPVTWAEARARIPFDLAEGPLFRAALGRVADDDHVLLIAIHHIVVDGVGLDVVLRELLAAYAGVPLADEVDRRRVREPTEERQQADLEFWRAELAGLPPELSIVRDRERLLAPSHRGGRIGVELGPDVQAAVVKCARSLGTTPAVVYHAAFRCLIALVGEDDDIAVGVPVNLREPDDAEAVGNFVNTLVVRTTLRHDPTFAEAAAAVGAALGRALDRRRIGFEHLVQALAPQRDMSRSPFFQVSFAHHSSPLPASLAFAGVVVVRLPVERGTAMFDLALQVAEWEGSASVHLPYAADLYDESTALWLLAAYVRILAAAVAQPELRLSELPLLAAAHERQVLARPAPGPFGADDRFGVAGRVAALAAANPGAVAVVAGGRTVSYAELDVRAGELAAAVEALELAPEAPIALLVDRGVDFVASMVACARLGHPYVPLDEEHPPRRLAQVLDEARPAALIGSPQLVARLDCPLPPVVDPTRVGGGAAPLRPLPPDTALYTIFTSGSTGRPKGVIIAHRNLLALLDGAAGACGYGPGDVWTCLASSAFDVSVFEIWGALTTGGRVVVLDREVARDPQLLIGAIRQHGVTILNQTPSAFRTLQQATVAAGEPPPPSLRLVVFGGEALLVPELKSWFALVGANGPRLVNMYGITETTVHSTAVEIGPNETARSPIGLPLPHLSTFVLDRRFRPVPVGVVGELYVGGHGLARGYAAQPGLTASRFVPDPYVTGGRLYRSGDRARWLRDGTLEFVGRVDDQLKVRGFRVEPGEVETALLAVEGVTGAAVVAREGRLIGFVVGDVETAAVRGTLAERLPDYLVPSVLARLPELPLTPNGKLDRRALPAVETTRPASVEYVAPRGPAEAVLASAFASVLGLEHVGVLDNFFELGGDSILAVQVAAVAAEQGVAVTVADVFGHPVVAELAAAAADVVAAAPASAPFALVAADDLLRLPADVVDAYPLAVLQAGMLFHQESGHESPAYHNVTSIEIGAPLDVELLQAAADRVVARHPVLRTSFDFVSFDEPLQLVWRAASMQIEVGDLRALPRADEERAINVWMAEAYRAPLPLDAPPLLRLHVHDVADDRFWLSLVECHAILDGWSFNSTIAELLTLYAALLGGQDPPAQPEPAVAFRDHVAAERAALGDRAAGAYFEELLAEAPPQALGSRNGKEPGIHKRVVPVPQPVQRRLEETARACGFPVKSLLLAAHAAVVGALAGTDDVVTGIVINGRPERAGTEDVRGLYLNTLPIRLQTRGITFRELVAAAFAHEGELWRHRLYPGAAATRWAGPYASDFVYTRFRPLASVSGGGVELLGNARELAHVDIPLAASFDHHPGEPSEHLALLLECARARFSEVEVDAISGLYQTMLAALATDLDRRVDAVPLLDAASDAQLQRWNDTARDYPDAPGPLHSLVERSASAYPDRVAVVAPGRTVTYAELDAEANRLARVLRRRGVGIDTLVGVSLVRRWELPIALLAVLKAGGGFVPIDPSYPAERRELIATDAGVRVLLDDAVLAETLAEAAAEEPTAPELAVPAEAACYTMFTSGSTGRPKGVVVSHRSIVNRLLWAQERFPLDADDAMLHKTSTSFDPSLVELFWPLLAGARLVLAEPGAERDPAALAATIERERVTVLMLVPTLLRAFVDEAPPESCRTLRLVFPGGEALSATLAADWHARFSARLVNLYGPTEASVDVAAWPVDEPGDRPGVPIGVPLANTRLHVLSATLAQVPPGVVGELYAGGVQLARGYHGRSGLTASRFVPDPFGPRGGRLYRTGDLVRRLGDGALEYLGRIDDQVKVRGSRIEPAEVEAALVAIDGVVGAAVVAREGRLVGYVTGEVEPVAVRQALADRLPDFLVPSLIVVLPALPLTANGKVDRRALPAPVAERREDVEYVAPRDPAEELLASVFASVLQVERIGVFDNFFELGGDSIRALTCAVRSRAAGLRLSPALIFECQTIAELGPRCIAAAAHVPVAYADADADADAPDLSQSGLDEAEAAALLERVEQVWQ